jgi:hypothetical protein
MSWRHTLSLPPVSRREHLDQTVSNPDNPAEAPYIVDYRIARERSTNLLQIRIKQTIIRDGVDTLNYMRTFHNIRTIRLRADERRALYTVEFIGSDAHGIQLTFNTPEWATLNYTVFEARALPAFERMGLTLHETQRPSVLEFSA